MVAPWGVQAERDRGDEGDHAIFAGWSRADWEFDASLVQATPRTDPAQPGAGEVETPPEVSLPNLPSPPAPKAPRRGPHANVATCQVDGCSATEASGPFRWKRCRICDLHASCSSFYHRGRLSRFCQLCKAVEPIERFDGANKSCSPKLAEHNRRRRERNRNKNASGGHKKAMPSSGQQQEREEQKEQQQHGDEHTTTNEADSVTELLKLEPGETNGNPDRHACANESRSHKQHQQQPKPPALLQLPSNLSLLSSVTSTKQPAQQQSAQAEQMLLQQKHQSISSLQKQPRMDVKKAQDTNKDRSQNSSTEPAPAFAEPKLEPEPTSASSGVDCPDRHQRAVFKLFGRTPECLPPNLKHQVELILQAPLNGLTAYMLPGCVELILDLLLPVEESELACKELACRLVQLGIEHGAIWRSGKWSLTVSGETAVLESGRIVSHYDCDRAPNAPTITSIEPLCMMLGDRKTVKLRGRHITGDSFRVSLTREGRCYTLPAHEEDGGDELSIDVTAVREGANLVQVSVTSDSRVSNTVPIIVVGEHDADVCDELNKLIQSVQFSHKGCTTLTSVIWQLGRVLAYGAEAASKPSFDELLSFCALWGLPSARRRLQAMRPKEAADVSDSLSLTVSSSSANLLGEML